MNGGGRRGVHRVSGALPHASMDIRGVPVVAVEAAEEQESRVDVFGGGEGVGALVVVDHGRF